MNSLPPFNRARHPHMFLWAGSATALLITLAAWRGWPGTSGYASATRVASTARSSVPLSPTHPAETVVTLTNVPSPAATNAVEVAPDSRRAASNPWLLRLVEPLHDFAGEPDPEKRQERLESMSRQISDAEIPGALSALTALNPPGQPELGRELRRDLVQRWAALDPAAAADWLGRMSEGASRTDSIQALAQAWGRQDPAAAMAWAQQSDLGADRDDAVVQLAYELARTDPLQALSRAVELPPTPRRDDLMDYATVQWATKNPQDAIAWASKIEDLESRQHLLAGIYTAWGEADPSAAATAAVQSMSASREQNDAVVAIIQRWTQRQPDLAATWVTGFPESDLRDTAVQEIVRLWSDQSVEKAGQWLNTLASGSLRDAAVAAYVEKVLPMSAPSAAQWASEIQEPTRQQAALEQIGENWLDQDRAAARAWIQQSPLAAETKARLLAIPPVLPTATTASPVPATLSLAESLGQ